MKKRDVQTGRTRRVRGTGERPKGAATERAQQERKRKNEFASVKRTKVPRPFWCHWCFWESLGHRFAGAWMRGRAARGGVWSDGMVTGTLAFRRCVSVQRTWAQRTWAQHLNTKIELPHTTGHAERRAVGTHVLRTSTEPPPRLDHPRATPTASGHLPTPSRQCDGPRREAWSSRAEVIH